MTAEQEAILVRVLTTWGPALRSRARAIVRDRDTAHDIVQEAALRLLKTPLHSCTERALVGCLFRAVHTLSLNEVRRRGRLARCMARAAPELRRPHVEALRGESVVGRAVQAEGADAVRCLFRVLTLLERQAVTLVHLLRGTVPEAAKRMGLGEKAVHRALGRARRKLGNLCGPRVQNGVDPDDVAAVLKGVISLGGSCADRKDQADVEVQRRDCCMNGPGTPQRATRKPTLSKRPAGACEARLAARQSFSA